MKRALFCSRAPRAATWGVVGLVWFLPTQLWAQASPSTLRVEVISCVLEEGAVDVTEMLAIARAELAPRELGRRESDADGEPMLRVDACHDEYLVLRSLRPPGPERRIGLHDVPAAQRPRVAALALAELVIVSRAQPPPDNLEKADPKSPAPAPKPAPDQPLPFPDWTPVEERSGQRPSTVGLGAETRFFTQSLGFAFGPRLDLSFRYLDVSILTLLGRQRGRFGEYQTGIVAISPSYPLYRSPTKAQFTISIGGEVGFTWGNAQPYEDKFGAATMARAPFASGFAQLGLSGPLSPRTYARIALNGGYAMGVYAGNEAVTRGPFAGAQLGLAWAL